ncbi:cytochrome b5-like isoform X2 [Cucurbita pepo subsp. pepo]|uniref:cytochrome b5-like isoform X2 n=1 Tax=Cucurbita pepo subsp. pepo TaxID=3664 RepID=UPI000C9D5E64|nr:cytochrome b5-like isoform X2 [Cucurbita pepo subsp. pepo]
MASARTVGIGRKNKKKKKKFRTRKICLPDYTTLFQAATMDGRTVFTLAEVASHDNRNDCWLIIEDKVYDVTKFLEDHPGGDEVLLSSTGKDATNDFLDVGHSSAASAMMEEFYVGDIDSSVIPAKGEYIPPKQPLYNQDKTLEFIIKVLQFLAPLVILGLAFGIHIYTKTT